MRPRILLRTHYQADEPRLIVAAVTHCARPTSSIDEGQLATCLLQWGKAHNLVLSRPAADYAVDNAKHLKLLTSSNHWSYRGLALAFVSKSNAEYAIDLTPSQQLLYLLYYLNGAGALLVTFAQSLLLAGKYTDEELRRDEIIERCLIDALDQYLRLAQDIRDRTAIRKERERMAAQDYAASTQRHKRYPLIRTMERLGLLDTSADEYRPTERLRQLAIAIPDIASLERKANESSLRAALSAIIGSKTARLPQSAAATVILESYKFAEKAGLQACPIEFLDDVVWSETGQDTQGGVETAFEALRKSLPRDVRFNVDRRGRRAFVSLSEAAQQQWRDLGSSLLATAPRSRSR